MRRPGHNWYRLLTIFAMVLLFLSLIPISTSALITTSAQITVAPEPINVGPEVTIGFLESEANADVAPGDACLAIFNGIASVDHIGLNTVSLTFNCVDTWGNAHADPPIIEFTPTDHDDIPFKVLVPVPRYTGCNEVGTVEVFGDVKSNPSGWRGNSNTITSTIHVNHYYCFTTLVMTEKSRRTAPGEEVEFELKVSNTGNGVDIYSMEVLNQDELDRADYVITMSQRRFDISKYGEEVIKIIVTPPSGLEASGKRDIELAITCEGNDGNGTVTQFETLTVNVELETWVFVSVYLIAPILLLVVVIVGLVFWHRKKKNRKK